MTELFDTLLQLVNVLGKLLGEVLSLAMAWSLLIAWVAWWLKGVNWQRLWPTLAHGAWAPAVLLLVAGAMVWSQIAPVAPCSCLANAPNFWWQLCAVGLLGGLTFLCGWLQGVFGWTPADISLDPPAVSHDNGHGHH